MFSIRFVWLGDIPFCHGDEENGHRACTNGHLTTADQSEIRKAYLASVKFNHF